jgi:hypothetical protein
MACATRELASRLDLAITRSWTPRLGDFAKGNAAFTIPADV